MTSNVQFNRRILEMEEVYIVSGVRTAIGKYGGIIKECSSSHISCGSYKGSC